MQINNRQVFDISPVMGPETAVYPGDVPFLREVSLDIHNGDHLTLSSMQTTLHIGAHTDAPSHYHRDGESIEARELDYYMGDCQVITVQIPSSERIRLEHIQNVGIRAPRVLFHTGSFPDPNNWNSDYNSLSVELVNYLAERGVKLVGIDTPSVDPDDSKDLPAHNAIYNQNLAILEGVVLAHVPDGLYTLVALPLKIKSGDASPVRAILLGDPLS